MPRRRGTRGDGGLTKRPNGRWQAQWSTTEGGKRRVQSKTFGLKGDAEWWLRQAKRGDVPDLDLTVAEYLDRWLASKRKIRPSTRDLYASHIKVHLKQGLGHLSVSELEHRHVERFVSDLETKVAAGTVGLILRTLKSALAAGVRRRELPDNPAANVEPPDVKRRPVAAMTDEDAERIRDAVAGTWIELIVRFLIGSGCRIGEACALNQGDVLDGFVRILDPKTEPRATYVADDGMDALREAIRQAPRRGAKEPVFYGPKTGDRVTRHAVWGAMRRSLGQSPHAMRHGAASQMAAAGWSMKVIAEQLGNTERVTASTYAHISPATARAAVGALDRKRRDSTS